MTTNTPLPPSSASKRAQRTSTGRRFLGALTRGPYRKFSGSHSPSSLKSKGLAFPVLALLAALAAGLLVLLPVGPLQAQQSGMIEHAENDMGTVATFTAVDPEEASPVLWSLLDSHTGNQDIPGEGDDDGTDDDVAEADIADAGAFKISDAGVLTFDEAPDYENPADAGTNNEYKVVVQASDGTEMSWFKVTVEVTDVEEEGSVKLSPTDQLTAPATTLLQPQVGVGITAHSLTDDDGTGADTRGITRDYNRRIPVVQDVKQDGDGDGDRRDRRGGRDLHPDRATAGDSDVGSYLRVVATYTDGRGSNKTATAVSEHPTIARISNNTAPEFPAESTTRAVLEEMPKGTAIGNPVTATDKDSGEILTYWLAETDASKFAIDARTGQLKVKTVLDFEGTAGTDNQCATTNACSVTVMVADSSGTTSTVQTPAGTDSITVTITVTGVDEKPGPFTGTRMIVHEEGTTALMDDTDTVTYTATDPEGGVVTLTLSGDDGDKFKLTSADARALEFKEKPDFENPGDMNRDNVYEVTVVASDGANSATRDVTVKVMNMEEDGKIEVMPAQPRVGTELTAELTDSDGIVSGPTWEWRRLKQWQRALWLMPESLGAYP